jgi:hypothetical protein
MTTFMFLNATAMFLIGAPVVGSLVLIVAGLMTAVEAIDDRE